MNWGDLSTMGLSTFLGIAAMSGMALSLAFDEKRRTARVLGRGWLVVFGFCLFCFGLAQGKAFDAVFGAALLGAARVSWRSMRRRAIRHPAPQSEAKDE